MMSSNGTNGRQHVNRKKFMDGRMSPEEAHAKFAFPVGAKCTGCGAPPTIRGIVMAPLDEVRKRDPDFDTLASLANINPEAATRFYEMLVQIKGSDGKPTPYVRISTAFSCKSCSKTFEKTLAKAPSWCIVEINRGPGPDKLVTSG